MISPQTEGHVREFKKEKGFTMELLSDPMNRVAEAYRLVYQVSDDVKMVYKNMGIDLEEYNGENTWKLPMPARYIVDRKGLVRYAVVNADHTSRPEPAETLAVLEKITA